MQHIDKFTITDRAWVAMKWDLARMTLHPGDLLVGVFQSTYINADGTTVEGFEPGYVLTPWKTRLRSDNWAYIELPNGTMFYFLPKFKWNTDDHYVVDLVGSAFAMFSIGPQ